MGYLEEYGKTPKTVVSVYPTNNKAATGAAYNCF